MTDLTTFMEWHTNPIEDTLCPNYENNPVKDFGILRIITSKQSIWKLPLAILFNLDNSSSMSDNVIYIKHTLKNMLNVCLNKIEENPDLVIYVCIDLFSHEVVNIFKGMSLHNEIDSIGDFILLNAASIELLMTKIESIRPWGCTNIEKSLQNSKRKLAELRYKHPEFRLVHIQLTDGAATAGEREYEGMIKYIDTSYRNVFIGYGENHDSKLLYNLASLDPKFDYRFVDKMSHCGMIYGELLYNILYCYDDRPIHINMSNELQIYDWKSNQWVDHLVIPPLVADTEKIYHICCKNDCDKDALYVNIGFSQDQPFDIANSLPLLRINSDDDDTSTIPLDKKSLNGYETNDLTQYLLRQRVLECLTFVREFEMMCIDSPSSQKFVFGNQLRYLDKDVEMRLITALNTNIDLLTKYKAPSELAVSSIDQAFLQTLIEDLKTTKAKIGTPKGFMYTNARQTSQGNQHSYTPSIPDGRDITSYTNDDMMSMMTQVYVGDGNEEWKNAISRTIPYDELEVKTR